MIRAVLDTNVLAPAFVGTTSVSVRLIEFWSLRRFELVVSEHLLGELRRTYDDPYYGKQLSPERVQRTLARLRQRAIVTEITIEVIGVATQPEDDSVLATALSGGATYLATRDKQSLKLERDRGVHIVHPGALLDVVLEAEGG